MEAEPQATTTLMLQPEEPVCLQLQLAVVVLTDSPKRAIGCSSTGGQVHAFGEHFLLIHGAGPQETQLGSSSQDRRALQLRQHLRGQSQIKAVVNRVIQMTRESQCFHLKVPARFDVIHECSGPAEALMQALKLHLTSSLQPPESIGNFGKHQLRRQNQFSLENRLPESSCLRRAFDDPHHR